MNIGPINGGTYAMGVPVSAAGSSAGSGDDAKIRELEKKLEYLSEEKKKAEENHDARKAQKLEQEIMKVKQQLEELKRKEKEKEEKKEEGEAGNQAPPDGVKGQYVDTWA